MMKQLSAARAVLRNLILATGALALLATPAQAQFSKDYEFLKAVRDKDGTVVTEMLNEPGTTIVNAKDSTSGESGLHIVVGRQDATWLAFLLQRGANPNIRDRAGVTPIVLASQLGWVDGVEQLVQSGASVDVADFAGETPLIAAVHRRDIMMMRALLLAGADPDRTDNSGRSARDYAELAAANDSLVAEIKRNEQPQERGDQPTYGPDF